MKRWQCLQLLGFFFANSLVAQDKLNIKFGKIEPADFTVVSPLIDSNANALILADIGSSEFVTNNKGWFSLVFRKHKRIKILNNKGFDAAETSVYLYSNGIETERLEDISANTYNIENGTVVTTKLDGKSIFEERLTKNRVKKKFTFPSVKAGSIIEYSYTIKSDFIFNLQPWEFQGQYPCLWSEYNVNLPDFFNYMQLSQGYLLFDINKNDTRYANFTIKPGSGNAVDLTPAMNRGSIVSRVTETRTINDQQFTLNTAVHDLKWVIKNAPALRDESFTSTINNHITKIEFQLSELRFPDEPVENVMGTWAKLSEKLLAREDFGLAFNRGNGWLDAEMKQMLKGTLSMKEKTKKIYEFVRDHFTCTNTYGIFLQDNSSLKEIFKRRNGSVAEINLLLLAMLRHESIPSEPVLLSLRNRGLVHPVYPILDRFNYLLCEVNLPGKLVYLDASKPLLGFDRLPASCYNGTAWVLRMGMPVSISFSPDSLVENKLTSVFIINDEKDGWSGSFKTELGDEASYSFREKMGKVKKEEYLKELGRNEMKIENLEIDSLKFLDEPVSVNYEFKLKSDDAIIYLDPMFGEEIKQNPFKSEQRLYPVEMPCQVNETYNLNMEIPRGYVVEEIPKSVKFKLNEDEGLFEFLCAKTAEKVQLRSTIKINKANFQQDDYKALRDFFAFIIKKQSEQIVFKKIK